MDKQDQINQIQARIAELYELLPYADGQAYYDDKRKIQQLEVELAELLTAQSQVSRSPIMSSEYGGFKQGLIPFVTPSFKAAEYADLESNNAQLRADISTFWAENSKLREECEYLTNEDIELKLEIYNLRKQLSKIKNG